MLVMCISHHIHQIVIARELFFIESPARICGNLIPHEVFNPLHPNIRMQVLQTVLYTFSQVLTGRICLKMKSLFRRGYWGHPNWQFADLPFFWHLVCSFHQKYGWVFGFGIWSGFQFFLFGFQFLFDLSSD